MRPEVRYLIATIAVSLMAACGTTRPAPDRARSSEAGHRQVRRFKAICMTADSHQARGDWEESEKHYREILAEYDSLPMRSDAASAACAAKAQFMLTEHRLARWDKLELVGNLRQQKEVLAKLIKGAQSLGRQYRKVRAYGSPYWALAARFRIGYLFQRFSDKLVSAKSPYRGNAQRYQIYRAQLRNIAAPLRNRAISDYKELLKLARDKNVDNVWTRRARKELRQLAPTSRSSRINPAPRQRP